MKQQIKHKYTDAVLFECELPDGTEYPMRDALVKAVANNTYLRGANLDGAYLDGAYLDGAYLRGAYLRGANLDGVYLRGANLDGAYLRGANLDGANLDGAYLDGANLGGAYLRGANLGGAYLDGAYLRGANLRGANLDGANIRGANLDGANLDGAKLVGERPYLSIGGIGSRQDYLTLWMTDAGNVFKTGCFTGLLDEFEASIKKTHGENNHAKEYAAAIAMCKAHIEIWTTKETA